MSEKVKLSYKGKDFEFPLVEGSENEKGIDIKSLRSQTGLITYDPGYKNTGSCKSDITFLDGEEGILRYRGYSIEDLCEKASFIEEKVWITQEEIGHPLKFYVTDKWVRVYLNDVRSLLEAKAIYYESWPCRYGE